MAGERLEGDRGTHDGAGAADNNAEYNFGKPGFLLKDAQKARLLILRSKREADIIEQKRRNG